MGGLNKYYFYSLFFLLGVFCSFNVNAQKRIPLPKTDSINRYYDSVPIQELINSDFSRLDSFKKKFSPFSVQEVKYKTFTKREGKLRVLSEAVPKVLAVQFLLGFICLGLVVYFHPGYVGFLNSLLFRRKNLEDFYEEQKFGFDGANNPLDIVFFLSLSIGASLFSGERKDNNLIWYPIFAAGFFYIRILFIQFIGWIFTRNDTSYQHLFLWLVWSRALAVGLFLSFFLIEFQPFFKKEYLALALLAAFFVIGVLWYFRLLRGKSYQSIWEAIYFFLYLCTVELSPVLIISRDFIQ